jgi:hypothetical protein
MRNTHSLLTCIAVPPPRCVDVLRARVLLQVRSPQANGLGQQRPVPDQQEAAASSTAEGGPAAAAPALPSAQPTVSCKSPPPHEQAQQQPFQQHHQVRRRHTHHISAQPSLKPEHRVPPQQQHQQPPGSLEQVLQALRQLQEGQLQLAAQQQLQVRQLQALVHEQRQLRSEVQQVLRMAPSASEPKTRGIKRGLCQNCERAGGCCDTTSHQGWTIGL